MDVQRSLTPVSYFVRVTLMRRAAEITKEREFWVHSYRMPPDSNVVIKMEVGIADCLHIEFEYKKAKYVTRGCDITHSLGIISRT